MATKKLAFRRLIDTNACASEIRKKKKILIYGTCIKDEHTNILKDFAKDTVPLAVCLEWEHMNMIGFKLVTMLRACEIRELIVLTIDGSPHCVQLHMAVEECKKIIQNPPSIKHYVIHKGKLIEVSDRAIKTSRYLSKIEKLLRSD